MVVSPINSGLTAKRANMLTGMSTSAIDPTMKSFVTSVVTFPLAVEHPWPNTLKGKNFSVTTTFYPA